ncbi:hypothetical protein D9611_011145 [Ephemerocybe angulata]|uniref:Uncharacterized protein n=1 Tax=Ephemerocybe angulata TaxID=980116 RepID=A0A8H5FJZ6_9AGAR|nr:hypothetical protein D9611_011145 [Tulosesus angulatus]
MPIARDASAQTWQRRLCFTSLYNDKWATTPRALKDALRVHLRASPALLQHPEVCHDLEPCSHPSPPPSLLHQPRGHLSAPNTAIRTMLILLRYKSDTRGPNMVAFKDDAEALFDIAFIQAARDIHPWFQINVMRY